jgi:pilus assembly protein Flp/PilA
VLTTFRNLLTDESAATAIEYGLIAFLVSIAAVVAFGTMGATLNQMLTRVSNCLADVAAGRPPTCI